MREYNCGRERNSMREGFSLVEVIIAIALLAILTMPILTYFTNAAVSTSRGKNIQKASMAAETAMEEVYAFESPEQIEEYIQAASATDWSIVSTAESKTGEAGKTSTTVLQRDNIEVDGERYKAKITLEYDYPVSSEAAASYNNPNSNPMPELKEVYSASNAVITESDQLDRAVSHYLMKYPDAEQNEIQKELSENRELQLKITEEESVYTVTGSYQYTYKGDVYDAVILRTKVKDLANIYFFYDRIKYTDASGDLVVQNKEETVNVEASTISASDEDKNVFKENMKNMHVYFICQKEQKEKDMGMGIDSAHKLKFIMNDNAKRSTYHTNIDPASAPVTIDKYEQGAVTSKPKGRIAKVTVDVYADTADMDTSESLTQLESSKGE